MTVQVLHFKCPGGVSISHITDMWEKYIYCYYYSKIEIVYDIIYIIIIMKTYICNSFIYK